LRNPRTAPLTLPVSLPLLPCILYIVSLALRSLSRSTTHPLLCGASPLLTPHPLLPSLSTSPSSAALYSTQTLLPLAPSLLSPRPSLAPPLLFLPGLSLPSSLSLLLRLPAPLFPPPSQISSSAPHAAQLSRLRSSPMLPHRPLLS